MSAFYFHVYTYNTFNTKHQGYHSVSHRVKKRKHIRCQKGLPEKEFLEKVTGGTG